MLATALVVAALSSVACSLLVTTEADQCTTDADCDRFGSYVCDRVARVCVLPTVADASADDDARDATVDDASLVEQDGGILPLPDASADATLDADAATDATVDVDAGPDARDGSGDGGADADSGNGDASDAADASDVPDAADASETSDADAADAASPCDPVGKADVVVQGTITADTRWACSSYWVLDGIVHVGSGVTLTIDKGTTVKGDFTNRGALVVDPGGKVVAVGTRDEPIVFTSARADGQRVAGDWLGVALVGKATVNRTATSALYGISTNGGADDDDSSGSLQYVRIEYTAAVGLSMFAVGRGTTIDHVEVRKANSDCFGWYGGTVNMKHLVCLHGGINGFAWNFGYRGKLQFLAFQSRPDVISRRANGIFGGNGTTGSDAAVPVSSPVVYNATFCGRNRANLAETNVGLFLSSGTEARIANALVAGFESGLNLRDLATADNARSGKLSIKNTLFSDNRPEPVAFPEDAGVDSGDFADDDFGFDEIAWASLAANANVVSDAGALPGCFSATNPVMRPAAVIDGNASTPPADGFFDTNARYVGAFRDGNDGWAEGAWVVWDNSH